MVTGVSFRDSIEVSSVRCVRSIVKHDGDRCGCYS